MLELPEALTLARQSNEVLIVKRVEQVLPPTKPHKFCWFSGDPVDYEQKLKGQTVCAASGFGAFAQLDFSGHHHICLQDGVNMRLVKEKELTEIRSVSSSCC